MLKHTLAGCLVGLLVALATWSFLPAHEAQPAPEAPRRGLSDKAYLGITYTSNPDQSLTLTQVYPATPAWDAGLVAGDTIMAVEVLRDGKRIDEPAPPTFLLLGLTTAAPGTEFRVKIERGDSSLAIEKAVLIDLPKAKCEIPCAQTFFDHIKTAMGNWNQRKQVWVNIKSCSFKEFSEFHMREQQVELIRTQILELQVRMEKEKAEIKQIEQNIKTLFAQERYLEAQTEFTRLQSMEKGFGLVQTLIGFALSIFGL